MGNEQSETGRDIGIVAGASLNLQIATQKSEGKAVAQVHQVDTHLDRAPGA